MTDEKIDRLRALIEEVGNAQSAGLIDDQSNGELCEIVAILAELDDAGIFGAKPSDPDPLICCTVTRMSDDHAIDVFIANGHREQAFLATLVADADHLSYVRGPGYSASEQTARRLPGYILNPAKGS